MATQRLLANKLNIIHNNISNEAILLAESAKLGKIPPHFLPRIEKTLAQSTVILSLIPDSIMSGDIEYMNKISFISQKANIALSKLNSITQKEHE